MSKDKRQFYRLAEVYPLFYRILDKNKGFGEYKKGVRVDLGGGGVKVLIVENFDLGTYLQLKINLQIGKNENPVEIYGEVVWRKIKALNEKQVYELGVEFFDYQEEERQKIIQYIYIAQINQKKKYLEGA